MKPFQLRDKATGGLRYKGAWLISFKAPTDGKYRRQIGGASFKEAEKTLRGILTDIERGVWVDPRVVKRAKRDCQFKTFGDICEAFAKAYRNRSEGAKKNLQCTLAALSNEKDGAPLLPPSTLISDLTEARLRAVREAIGEATDRTVATKNQRVTYLKMILRWAWKHPSIPVSVHLGEGIEHFKTRGTRGGDGMTLTVTRDEVFSRSDCAKLVEYAFENSDLVTAYMIQTALLTGLRKGEIAGVKWCDVDFDRRLILVCRNYDRRGTKSGHDRSVPIVAELGAALRKWKAKSPYSKEADPVFPGADGKHRRESYDLAEMVHGAAVGAGVARPGMRRWGHLTRHTFATQWLLSGGSDSMLARILGHRDTTLIHAVYSHFCDLDFVAAVDRIGLTLEPKTEHISMLPGVLSSEFESKVERANG